MSAPESGALEFDPKEITVKAGKVTFNFSNPSGVPHALDIEGVDGGEGETVQGDDAPPLTVDLEPGDVRVLLPGRRPPRGRHDRDAHGRVSPRATAVARKSKIAARSRATSGCAASPSGQYGSA